MTSDGVIIHSAISKMYPISDINRILRYTCDKCVKSNHKFHLLLDNNTHHFSSLDTVSFTECDPVYRVSDSVSPNSKAKDEVHIK